MKSSERFEHLKNATLSNSQQNFVCSYTHAVLCVYDGFTLEVRQMQVYHSNETGKKLVGRRLQAQSLNSPDRYTGMVDAFRRTFRHEGVRGFYKGLLPNMLKVVPSASITYLVYEDMKTRLSLK